MNMQDLEDRDRFPSNEEVPKVREGYLLILDQADGYQELVLCKRCMGRAELPRLADDEIEDDVLNCQTCGRML